MPKVSVIIPAYNAERYIAETLDSVLSQTYTDFEVIVVDDGSKDQTASIVKKYQDKNPAQIILIRKENGGPASARNAGIEASRGEYIAFNDADDLWLPEKLEKQVLFFDFLSPDIGLVYTNARKFDCDGLWDVPGEGFPRSLGGYENLLKRNPIPNQSVMVRKRCFGEVGLFDESLAIIEDHDMWLRISKKFKLVYMKETLSLYREQNQGRSKGVEKTLKRALGVMYKHLKMVSGDKALEDAIIQTLSRQLFNLGYFYLTSGSLKKARESFQRSLDADFQFKTFLMKAVTFLPFSILNRTHALRKRIYQSPGIKKSKSNFEKLMGIPESSASAKADL